MMLRDLNFRDICLSLKRKIYESPTMFRCIFGNHISQPHFRPQTRWKVRDPIFEIESRSEGYRRIRGRMTAQTLRCTRKTSKPYQTVSGEYPPQGLFGCALETLTNWNELEIPPLTSFTGRSGRGEVKWRSRGEMKSLERVKRDIQLKKNQRNKYWHKTLQIRNDWEEARQGCLLIRCQH